MAYLTTLLVVGRIMVKNKFESIMEVNHRALELLIKTTENFNLDNRYPRGDSN
jgi:hypothetical protein